MHLKCSLKNSHLPPTLATCQYVQFRGECTDVLLVVFLCFLQATIVRLSCLVRCVLLQQCKGGTLDDHWCYQAPPRIAQDPATTAMITNTIISPQKISVQGFLYIPEDLS
ncbi:hypothetical protein AMECASPLE_003465 [Ameca splendens]|uniref:Uncharacterized protein n=1 Tax=Ameca splendens TaxID=208324 RepID=A0ABV0Y9M8_9TELE